MCVCVRFRADECDMLSQPVYLNRVSTLGDRLQSSVTEILPNRGGRKQTENRKREKVKIATDRLTGRQA